MIFPILGFLAGDLCLQMLPSLPSLNLLMVVLLSSLIMAFIFYRTIKLSVIPLAFICGFIFSAFFSHSLLSWNLPKEWEGQSIVVRGYIQSIPLTEQFGKRFIFKIEEFEYQRIKYQANVKARLMWKHFPEHIKVGGNLQLVVKLKRIHSIKSPGAFDFEAWALQQGLRATGYVIESKENKYLSSSYHAFINQWRNQLLKKIKLHLPATSTAPWLIALTLGEREGIVPWHWQVLRNTGTNHLMAIAGLHIGIMSGLAFGLINWVWRLFPRLVLTLPAKYAAGYASLIMALVYSALAGFSIPTQRACIMLSIFIFALLSKRNISIWQSWSLALLLVLLINPASILTESFWLSFGTIALIIYGMSGRLNPQGWWWKWGRVQWVVGIGLTPLTLIFFQQSSLISFAANSIAIPYLSFFILPLCLLSTVFLYLYPPAASLLLWMADKSLSGLWIILTWFSHLSVATWEQAIPSFILLLTTSFGFILLLIPAGLPGRWLGLTWLLPLFFYQTPKPLPNTISVSLLDVGQGLAVLVRTTNHSLIYDAGPSFGINQDAGENVILPYLRQLHLKQLDTLVISHGDNDHLGGAKSLMKAYQFTSIKTSVPEKIPSPITSYCLAGERWNWDGVEFKFIYPTLDFLNLGNDSSCVLKISVGNQSILLTGDIEKIAENYLLNHSPELLASSVLIAPHHGSKTSAIKDFVRITYPEIVFYATGYRNRYRFPHPSVTNQYAEINTQQFNTAETGTVEFTIEKNSITPLSAYRKEHKRYWMDE